MGVRGLEAAVELQASFTESALEGDVSGMTKLGGMYADVARDGYGPVERVVAAAAEIVEAKAEKMAGAAASAAG